MHFVVDFVGQTIRATRPRHLLDLELETPPAGALLDLEALKAHLVVSYDTDDDLIEAFAAAIAESLDGYTGTLGRALLTQTWKLYLDRFPQGRLPLRLPLPPLQSVTSIVYLDALGDAQTLDPATYVVLDGRRAEIEPAYGFCWPRTLCQARSVTVEFVCGYGEPADVPKPIKTAATMYVAALYENREQTVIGPRAQVIENPVAEALLTPYRLLRV